MNKEIYYEMDNCIIDLDTLIALNKRAMKDVENNTHKIEQQEVLTIIREFIRLKNDYENLIARFKKNLEVLYKYEDELAQLDEKIEFYENKVFDRLDNYINLDEFKKLNLIKIKGKEYISKDKIKETLGIEEDLTEEDLTEEKILNYIDILVRENNRLEDIEDRKVQIEYRNVFNKGVKSVKDKIKDKITYYEDLIKTNPEDEEILRHIIQALNEILEESEE